MLILLNHTSTGLPADHSIFHYIFSAGESLGFAGIDIFL